MTGPALTTTDLPKASDFADATAWPHLSNAEFYTIIAVNIGWFIAAYVWLRLIWPSPTAEENKRQKELESQISSLKTRYMAIPVEEDKECIEGDSAGDYAEHWTRTFDLTFLIIMTASLVALLIWTELSASVLWSTPMFWLGQFPKLLTMMLVSYIGGLACRYFCEHDEKGYIITNRTSIFKVNYTRKLQHFAAYMVPLLWHSRVAESVPEHLALAWGDWVTLVSITILHSP